MYDARLVNTHFTEPTLLVGRFAGAGAAVPTPTAGNADSQPTKTSLARAGVGNLLVTFLDVPMGVVQSYDFWCASNNVADRNVRVTPPAVGSYAFQLNVTFMANGVASDVALGEELVFEVWTKRAQSP